MIPGVLERVVSGEVLKRAEAKELVRAIMQGDGNELEIAGLLAAMRTRGESTDEVIGAAEAMRELAIELPDAPDGAIDTCGTGGDGSNTFNISTVAALVVAAGGVPVAKHGNRAASSRCGSAEVLEALGVDLDAPPDLMAQSVTDVGIGFLFARACHPAMARVAPIRSGLGIRTLFNRLGPLTNPMGVTRQVVGVAVADQLEEMLRALIELGARRAWVVHGEDGLDEISVCAPTRVLTYEAGATDERVLRPGEHVPVGAPDQLQGGDADENAGIARAVLSGERGPRRDVVLLNAAAGFCVAERVADLDEGVRLAGEIIDSGRAERLLARFVAFTRGEELPE
ncbi:MAG: anthranilate phosphoribosyltransferase [Myxococcota bacterium]